jgi:hypothetical protein
LSRLLALVAGWKSYAAVAAICLAIGASGTWRVMSWRERAGQAQAVNQTVQIVERCGKIAFDVAMNFEKARLVDAEAISKRQEEIPQHVTPQMDHDYPVPCGFVRVFNAATHGPIPDPTGCPDDAPSDVALSAVGEVQTQNAGQYDQVAGQLRALQDWVRQQQQVP